MDINGIYVSDGDLNHNKIEKTISLIFELVDLVTVFLLFLKK